MRPGGPRRPIVSRSSESKMSVDAEEASTLLSQEAFANLRACSLDSLRQACDRHRIFCVTIDAAPLYPSFYVDRRFDQRQLEAITKVLGDLTGGSKWMFFTTPKGSLGSVTPLLALLEGRYARVRATAQGYAER